MAGVISAPCKARKVRPWAAASRRSRLICLRLRLLILARKSSKLAKPSLVQWNWVPMRCSQPASPSASHSGRVQKVMWTEEHFCAAIAWRSPAARAPSACGWSGLVSSRGPGTGEKGAATCSLG